MNNMLLTRLTTCLLLVQRRKVKHYLEGTYGWPDNFNQEAWDEDRDRIWEETEDEYERLGRPNVLRFS